MTPATARAALPDLFTRPILCAALALLCTLLAILPAAETAPGTAPALPALRSERATASLPQTLTPLASTDIGAAEQGFWPVEDEGSLQTRGAGIRGSFQAGGAVFQTPAGSVGMTLNAVGDARHLEALREVLPSAHANQVRYDYGALSESYSNGPYGLEQGFTLARPLAGPSNLELKLGLSGTLLPRQQGSQILFQTKAAINVLRYSGLSALDASGRELPARMQLSPNGTLLLQIDTRDARYPVRIDPFVQKEKLVNGETATGGSGNELGFSVALSANGDTALLGAPQANHHRGAAWVFTRSGSHWTQQGKLLPAVVVGEGLFGYSVALSADGATALVGGLGAEKPTEGAGVGFGRGTETGAAWIYTRSGNTWSEQAALPIVGTETAPEQGSLPRLLSVSVALSADGNTALVEGPALSGNDPGAAYIYARSGTTWTEQTELELNGSEPSLESELGLSVHYGGVALSADGNTALIGVLTYNYEQGAAWVFARSGSTWSQQGRRLVATGEIGDGQFGASAALSADGDAALVGGPSDNASTGAVWAFARAGSTWSAQGEKLTGKGEAGAGAFGSSLSLSTSGTMALIGGKADRLQQGAAWVFKRSGSTWSQQGEKLVGNDYIADFGAGVGLSGNAKTALIGAPYDSNQKGAADVFEEGKPVAQTKSTLTIEQAVPSSSALLVRVAISAEGTVVVSGQGVTGESKREGAGVYEFRLPFTKTGQSLYQHSGSIKVKVKLKTETESVSASKKVKL